MPRNGMPPHAGLAPLSPRQRSLPRVSRRVRGPLRATYGDWRPVIREVADTFLARGVLAHGFARVRCDTCTHVYLLAFSCKARYFCPSCHAKHLALWTLWLEESLLVPGVPHRQVVLTMPKRRRAWCLYRRSLLGDLARVAAHTVTAAVRALTGEPTLTVGLVGCIQTHGSLANWHPHIHMIATDGGFRPDGTFRAVARARHRPAHGGVSPRRAPALRAPRASQHARSEHARLPSSGPVKVRTERPTITATPVNRGLSKPSQLRIQRSIS